MRLNVQRALLVAASLAAPRAAAHELSLEPGWSADAWLIAIALALTAIAYARGAVALRRAARRRAPSNTEIAAFACGWLALAVALISPLDAWSDELFSAHMVQHELLMLVAAPLIVLGKPLGVLAWSLPGGSRVPSLRRLRAPLAGRAWRIASSPLVAWCLHAAALWAWHMPRAFEAGLADPWIHAAQHASFFATALLFWWALVRRAPSGAAVLYVLGTAIHTGVLGALLTFAPAPLYPAYGSSTTFWGLSALEDQQLGGLIMWVPAGALLLVAGLLLFARWLDAAERRGALRPGR
jgi:putative membrane protein